MTQEKNGGKEKKQRQRDSINEGYLLVAEEDRKKVRHRGKKNTTGEDKTRGTLFGAGTGQKRERVL